MVTVIDKVLQKVNFRATCLAVLLACVSMCVAQQSVASAADIPEGDIVSLQKELSQQNVSRASTTSRRRGYKGIVRDGDKLLDASPTAPNRFRVLAIMLQSQRRLLTLDNSERNREALFETCEKLVKAPDEYAELRLEADILLSDKDLTLKNADIKQRAEALAELIERYRDTPGEAKSLMFAALIAPKLEAFELEKQITRTMDERFGGDLDVIEWRRKHRNLGHFRVVIKGTFKRADGTSLTFPNDVLGHTYLAYFWSKQTPDIAEQMGAVKDLQTRLPGQLEVFSFNLDELADAGEETLRTLGLDWTAMRLPGGRKNQVYRVYATRDPIGVRVNAHGHALLPSALIIKLTEEMPMEQNFDDARYLSQIQSLLIGDFLVNTTDSAFNRGRTAESVPAETLDAIQACFIAAPLRYRLTRAEALANYQKADKLCRDAITRFPKASDLWQVRNCRTIALLGMWNLATDPKHLEAAVEEAHATLALDLPQGANVVPQFCLAKNAIRQGDVYSSTILSSLIKETGGTDAPASAHAAAVILAIDANDRELHDKYREMLLKTDNSDPMLWSVISFLRDQNHRFRLFKANYYMPPSLARRIVRSRLRANSAALDRTPDTSGPLQAEFTTLTGEKLSLPEATDGKLTLVMFVEPPVDPGADFPTAINGTITEDSRGNKKEVSGVMQKAFEMADLQVDKEIKVIAAFVCDDRERVKTLMDKLKWPCQAVMVPGGLKSPLLRQLGILWADRVPNIVLLRGDGTIAWTSSGVVHPQLKSEGVGELMHVITMGLKANIDANETKASSEALKNTEEK